MGDAGELATGIRSLVSRLVARAAQGRAGPGGPCAGMKFARLESGSGRTTGPSDCHGGIHASGRRGSSSNSGTALSGAGWPVHHRLRVRQAPRRVVSRHRAQLAARWQHSVWSGATTAGTVRGRRAANTPSPRHPLTLRGAPLPERPSLQSDPVVSSVTKRPRRWRSLAPSAENRQTSRRSCSELSTSWPTMPSWPAESRRFRDH